MDWSTEINVKKSTPVRGCCRGPFQFFWSRVGSASVTTDLFTLIPMGQSIELRALRLAGQKRRETHVFPDRRTSATETRTPYPTCKDVFDLFLIAENIDPFLTSLTGF